MSLEHRNRYRVSTKFISVKIGVAIGFLSVFVNLYRILRDNDSSVGSILPLVVLTFVLAGILYFVVTRNRIDYDDIKQCLYIVNLRKDFEIEVPIENVDRILLSGFGSFAGHAYKIYYRDGQRNQSMFWLFPIPFDNSIKTIVADCRIRNPDLVYRNWSFGWNELQD